jgi:hypothetical protein
MNWINIFKPSDILTPGDRAELQSIEDTTAKHREVLEKVNRDLCDPREKPEKLKTLAEELARSPGDADLYLRVVLTASMPTSGISCREIVAGVLENGIRELLRPSVAVVRRVFSRALERAEVELRKTEDRERGQADKEGYKYLPSGRVEALQGRVLKLRNAIAEKYSFEGGIVDPPHWRERLAEWL